MNFAGKAVEFVFKRRKSVAAAAFLFLCAAAAAICSADFNANVYDILPVSDSTLTAHMRASEKLKQSNTLYFNVSGENAEAACEALAKEVGKLPGIASISGSPDGFDYASFISGALTVLPEIFSRDDEMAAKEKISYEALRARMADFKRRLSGLGSYGAAEALSSDPLGLSSIFYDKLKAAYGDFESSAYASGIVSDSSGKNFLVAAEGSFDSSDSDKSAVLMRAVDKAVAGITKEYPGAKISVAGGYRISAENAAIAARDSALCLTATVAFVAALCFVAFSSRVFASMALLPPLFGTAAAFCAISALFGSVSTIAVGFASVAVGVGIDYAVHILYRLDGAGKAELGFASKTASELALPVAITSGTTAIAFAIIGLYGSSGFSQLGIFGAVGVLFSAAISVFVLPAAAVGLGSKKRKQRPFDKLAGAVAACASSRSAAAAVAALCALSVPFALQVRFNGDLSALSALGKQAKADDATLKNVWGGALSKTFVFVEADTPDGAKEKCAKIERWLKQRRGASVCPLSPLLPDSKTLRQNSERWKSFWTRERIEGAKEAAKKAARDEGINPAALSFRALEIQPETAPKEKRIVSEALKKRFWQDAGGSAAAVFVKLADGTDKRAFAEDLEKFDSSAHYIDVGYLSGHIASETFKWLIKFALAAFCAAAAYICALTRSASVAGAVLAPVLIGLLWAFGIFGAFGVEINAVNVVFVIFAVCIAQDYAVFMIFSKSKAEDKSSSTAAVLISAITTVFAFGTLGFAEHPVLRSLGLSASISIFSILCACLAFSGAPARRTGGGVG